MPEQTWFFDRLGENLNVPAVHIPTTMSTISALVQHIQLHLEADSVRGLRLERRTTGGYDIVDRITGFVYGQARTTRNFGNKSFPVLPPTIKPRNSPQKKAGNK